MNPQIVIDRPLFVVGCGRSGTTLLYQMLCTHPDLAWFSTYTTRWPRVPQMAAASRLYPVLRRRGVERRGLPLPSEGYRLWDSIRPPAVRELNTPLTENDVAVGERDRAEALVMRHLRYQGKRRFINKNTRNVRRIRYVNGLFPDAHFIHILRDPRATTASLLNVQWWPDLPIWCFENRTPREWVAQGQPEETMAAEVWRQEVETALEHKRAIPSARYLELRYEDLISQRELVLTRILEFVGLQWSPGFRQALESFPIRNSNVKYQNQLSPSQILEIERVTGPVAASLGYDVPAR